MIKEERFEIYKTWCILHNRLPSQHSKDDPIEKSLGIWRINNKNWEELIKFNSQFKSNKSREQRFKEEYIPWCILHNRLPRQYSEDKTESSLGIWRINNKNWEELIKFNSQFEAIAPILREQRFKEEYIPWCLEHKRLPRQYSEDKTERSLGKWRFRYSNWEELIKFNSQFKSKRKSREQRFEEEYIPWCLEHKRLPSSESKDDPIEKSLGIWKLSNKNWEVLKNFNSIISGLQKGDSMAISILEKF